jgi:hypothetical protein
LASVEPFARWHSTESLKTSKLAATTADFNQAMEIWDDHLGKIKSSSQLNSIYNKWPMTKLEVIAKSVFTAYRLRQQNEDADLLTPGVGKMEVDSSRMSFNKKGQEDFKGTTLPTEIPLRRIDNLPCEKCAQDGSNCDPSLSCKLCEMAGENCLRYYAISESERR